MSDNIRAAMQAADQLILDGFAPFIPHLYFHMDLAFSQDECVWLEVEKPYVLTADALLRLPGESKGADLEMDWAIEAGVPVFTSLAQLRDHFGVGSEYTMEALKQRLVELRSRTATPQGA